MVTPLHTLPHDTLLELDKAFTNVFADLLTLARISHNAVSSIRQHPATGAVTTILHSITVVTRILKKLHKLVRVALQDPIE